MGFGIKEYSDLLTISWLPGSVFSHDFDSKRQQAFGIQRIVLLKNIIDILVLKSPTRW